jgi:hypothetical protein
MDRLTQRQLSCKIPCNKHTYFYTVKYRQIRSHRLSHSGHIDIPVLDCIIIPNNIFLKFLLTEVRITCHRVLWFKYKTNNFIRITLHPHFVYNFVPLGQSMTFYLTNKSSCVVHLVKNRCYCRCQASLKVIFKTLLYL